MAQQNLGFFDALFGGGADGAGLSGGLLGLSAALSDAGRPRLVMREGYGPGLLGAVGNAGAALGMGMQRGKMAHAQDQMAQDEVAGRAHWRGMLEGMAPEQRALYSAMGPQAGAKAMLDNQRRQDAMREFSSLAAAMGGGAPAGFAQQAVPDAAPAAAPATSGVSSDWVGSILRQENNTGNPAARNPRSSAMGNGQFINSTWLEFAKANPALFQGMSEDQILAARANPELSRRATEWYGQQNAQQLTAQGLPVSAGTLSLAHFLGPAGAAAVLRAPPTAPVSSVLPPEVIQANPFLANKTAGDVIQMRGGAPETQTAIPRDPEPPMRQQSGINPQVMFRMAGLAAQYPELAPAVQTMATMFRQENPSWQQAKIGDSVFMVNPQNPMQRIRLGPAPETAPMSPDRFRQQQQIAEAGRTNVTQNADIRGENAFAQAEGAALAKEAQTVRDQAAAGAGLVDNIRALRTLDAETGRLAPAKEVIGGWMSALGLSSPLVKQAQTLQQFNGALSNLVLGKQLEQNGVQTEGDAKRMQSIYGSITNLREANDFLLRMQEAQAMRLMERGEFFNTYRQSAGPDGKPRTSTSGASSDWNRYIRETPLIARGADGQPITFYEFMQNAETRGIERDKALDAWRQNARGGR